VVEKVLVADLQGAGAQPDDATLIERSRAGEPAAFGKLVIRYQDRLYNTLIRVCGEAEEARDVAQEAFVQAFVKLDSFRGNSAFYTWLYRIAFNTAISRRRRRKPTSSLDEARDAAGFEPVDPDTRPEANLDREEQAVQVRAALATLSEEHRSVLVLREIDGCDYETIGKMLDVPVGTVRSRLHRARMQLREEMEKKDLGSRN
jgi:RNA polymerase sigma-70 factor (ECF subfamily)